MVTTKKKNVSKKNKSSWRKHVNIDDVDNFLEEKRLEERLGGPFELLPSSEIFAIDTKPSTVKKLTSKQNKRQKIRNSIPKCFQILQPHSKVPDPLIKRNRVRTKEERKHPLLRKREERQRRAGIFKAKELQASRDRALSKESRANRKKPDDFDLDIWDDESVDVKKRKIVSQEWYTNDTKRHNLQGLGKTNKRMPKTVTRKTTVHVNVEAPHPGMSYNPSFEDHQNLLSSIAEREVKIIKTERHLNRVTHGMFKRITQAQKDGTWMVEMSEGLPTLGSAPEPEDDVDYKSVNPPVKNKKKTLQQKRKKKEQRVLAQSRTIAKKEKKKVSDIYRLKRLGKQIEGLEKDVRIVEEKRTKMRTAKMLGTKQLSARKYEEPDMEFKMGNEICGNLRGLKIEGNLLRDRFVSLQKRNKIEVTVKQTKRRAKVKRFVRSGHKDDWKTTIASMK